MSSQPLTYSWIALTAASPVVMVLITWGLAVFHCKKQEWRSMDVFLVAILSQAVIQQFLGFIFALLSLLKVGNATGDQICTGMIWFFTSIPIFKGTTIVSLALDRFFNLKFPYRYRLSVRRNQVRYHVAVLAILSIVVGIATVLNTTTSSNNSMLLQKQIHHHHQQQQQQQVHFNSRDNEFENANGQNSFLSLKNRTVSPYFSPYTSSSSSSHNYSFDQCTFIPYELDYKFILFYISLHSLLIILGMVTLVILKFYLCFRKYPVNINRSTSDLNVLAPTLSNTSTASSSISSDNQKNNGYPHPSTVNPLAAIHMPAVHGMGTFGELTSSGFTHTPPGLSSKQILNMPHFKPPKKRSRTRTNKTTQVLTSVGTAQPEIRVSTAISILFLTIICTHIPLLGATIIGYYFPDLIEWPLANLVLWAQILEGLALPLILVIVDPVVPKWIFTRSTSSLKKAIQSSYQPPSNNYNQRTPLTLLQQDALVRSNFANAGPGHNRRGNVGNFCLQSNNNRNSNEFLHNQRLSAVGGLQKQSANYNNGNSSGMNGTSGHYIGHKFPLTNGSLFASLTAHNHNQLPNYQQGGDERGVGDDCKKGLQDYGSISQDNIYISLNNDDFDSFASFNKDSFCEDLASLDDDRRCASVTTVANDDFEFHQPSNFSNSNSKKENESGEANHFHSQQQQQPKNSSTASSSATTATTVFDNNTFTLSAPSEEATSSSFSNNNNNKNNNIKEELSHYIFNSNNNLSNSLSNLTNNVNEGRFIQNSGGGGGGGLIGQQIKSRAQAQVAQFPIAHYPVSISQDKNFILMMKSHTDDEFEEDDDDDEYLGSSSLSPSQKLTSLSMNDLDLLEEETNGMSQCGGKSAFCPVVPPPHRFQMQQGEKGEPVKVNGKNFVTIIHSNDGCMKSQSSLYASPHPKMGNNNINNRSSFNNDRVDYNMRHSTDNLVNFNGGGGDNSKNSNSSNTSTSTNNCNNSNSNNIVNNKRKYKYKKADQHIYISHVPLENRRMYRKRVHSSAKRPNFVSNNFVQHFSNGRMKERKVLSLESLSNALNESNISYLDNGDLIRHPHPHPPPPRRILFVTDFI